MPPLWHRPKAGASSHALQTLARPSPSLSVLGRPEPRRRERESPYSFREFDGSGLLVSGQPDLQGGGHGSLRLPRAKVAAGDFSARLVELGFDLIGQLKTVFLEHYEHNI